jgi:hypothetical protein
MKRTLGESLHRAGQFLSELDNPLVPSLPVPVGQQPRPQPENVMANNSNGRLLLALKDLLDRGGPATPEVLATTLAPDYAAEGEDPQQFLLRVRALLEKAGISEGGSTAARHSEIVKEYLNEAKPRPLEAGVQAALSMFSIPGQIVAPLTADRHRAVVAEYLDGGRQVARQVGLSVNAALATDDAMSEGRRQAVVAEATANLPAAGDWQGKGPRDQEGPAMQLWDTNDERQARLQREARADQEQTQPAEADEADLTKYKGLRDRLYQARLEQRPEHWKTAIALSGAIQDLGKAIDSRRRLPPACLKEFEGLLAAAGRG